MPVESARRQDKLVKHWYARLGTWRVCVFPGLDRTGSGLGLRGVVGGLKEVSTWRDGQMFAFRLRGKGDLAVCRLYTPPPPPRRTNLLPSSSRLFSEVLGDERKVFSLSTSYCTDIAVMALVHPARGRDGRRRLLYIPKGKNHIAHIESSRAYDISRCSKFGIPSQGERRRLDSDSGLFPENRVYLQTPHGSLSLV